MTTLANYPNYSQLAAKINGPNDCVPTSIKDAVKYLVGVELDLDGMMTAVYGPNYQGFTSARAFVPYVAEHGVKLFPIDGENATLVQAMHTEIKALHPCLLTEPDPYAPLHPDWSHVLSVYEEDAGTLTARDPYSTHDVTHADAEWASLLEFREVWALERIEELPKVLTIQEVAYFFEEQDATHWLCKQTGHSLHDGMLTFYKGYGGNALCGLTWLGLPKTDEIKIEEWRPPLFAKYAGHGITIQFCECGVLCYDPGHLIDQRPGLEGSVYLLQLYNGGPGTDPGIAKLQAQLAQLQQGVNNPQLVTDMQQIRAISGKY